MVTVLQAPETVGCNAIHDYEIWYRLKSAAGEEWTKLTAFGTSHTLALETADYDIRVVVTNDAGHSNYVELSYEQGRCHSNKYVY